MTVTSAMVELEEQLDRVLEEQRAASSRHDKALAGLKEALDRLARVFDLTDEEEE